MALFTALMLAVMPWGLMLAGCNAPARRPAAAVCPPEAEQALREPLEAAWQRVRQAPRLAKVFDVRERRIARPPVGLDDVFTLFVKDYAVDVPRAAFRGVHNPHLFREGVGLQLDGGCRLLLYVDQTLGLPQILCDLAGEYDFAAAGLGGFAEQYPECAAAFKQALAERLCREDEYTVLHALYGRDFTQVAADELSPAELYAITALAGMKLDVRPNGVDTFVRPIRTPYYRGFRYGTFAGDEHRWYDLYLGERRVAKFNIPCMRREEPSVPNERDIMVVLASVRPHGSDTPGLDMLAAARSELEARGEDERSHEIARSQILCAIRWLGVDHGDVQEVIELLQECVGAQRR